MVTAIIPGEQEFFDRLSELAQKRIAKSGLSTVHDVAEAIRSGDLQSDEIVRGLQAINFVYLPDPEEEE